MKSSHHALDVPGYKRATMVFTKSSVLSASRRKTSKKTQFGL